LAGLATGDAKELVAGRTTEMNRHTSYPKGVSATESVNIQYREADSVPVPVC
jgi:hypothetical protein